MQRSISRDLEPMVNLPAGIRTNFKSRLFLNFGANLISPGGFFSSGKSLTIALHRQP